MIFDVALIPLSGIGLSSSGSENCRLSVGGAATAGLFQRPKSQLLYSEIKGEQRKGRRRGEEKERERDLKSNGREKGFVGRSALSLSSSTSLPLSPRCSALPRSAANEVKTLSQSVGRPPFHSISLSPPPRHLCHLVSPFIPMLRNMPRGGGGKGDNQDHSHYRMLNGL